MKIKTIILGCMVCLDIGFIMNFHKYDARNKIFCSLFFVATILVFIWICANRIKRLKMSKQNEVENQYSIQCFRSGMIPRLEVSTLLLKEDEFSSFECDTYASVLKNKRVGSIESNEGASVRVTNRVYLNSGKSGSKEIYKDVAENYQGRFIVTNRRLVFISSGLGFEIPYSKLTSVYSSVNTLNIQSEDKSYGVSICSPEVIEELIKAIIRI
ncbi:PH domain-containing protein [Lacrimispora aerotolerans]|uniref:PH domain-containing protein n=1 Tax=Lacrimispora aerotolerans TaxID=36832 RepID=UPI00047E54BD|nr:PH domain-containing protein [Lacrimispora aerotolerans]